VPVDVAVTHFVGLSGVGPDAADPEFRSDPANVHKLGVFGYDQPMALKSLERGLSNTALMIQIPHDGRAAPGAWLAGGGSTVRGVPEKGSIKPFVSTRFNGQRGTMLLMADGSVRFVSEKISDTALQALVTVKGPTPEGFELDVEAPRVPPPVKKDVEKKEGEAPPEQPAPAEKPAPPAEEPPVKPKEPPVKEEPQAKAPVPAGWQEFSPAGEGFAVAVPGAMEQKVMNHAGGSKTSIYRVLDQSNEPKEFSLVVTQMGPKDAQLTSEKKLDVLRNWAQALFKARFFLQQDAPVKADRAISLGKNSGREFVLEDPASGVLFAVHRAYIVDNTLYCLGVSGPNVTVNSAVVRDYFNSFRVLVN
jgi:hypothetical protein